MAKRTKKRQSTLPDPAPKPVPAFQTPYARASFFTIYIVISIVIGLGAAAWYQSYVDEKSAERDWDSLETSTWKVVELPGKGLGMIAVRNITVSTLSCMEVVSQ
jgi:hypothetical protein